MNLATCPECLKLFMQQWSVVRPSALLEQARIAFSALHTNGSKHGTLDIGSSDGTRTLGSRQPDGQVHGNSKQKAESGLLGKGYQHAMRAVASYTLEISAETETGREILEL